MMLYRVIYGKRDMCIGFCDSRKRCQNSANGALEKIEGGTRGNASQERQRLAWYLEDIAPIIYCCLANNSLKQHFIYSWCCNLGWDKLGNFSAGLAVNHSCGWIHPVVWLGADFHWVFHSHHVVLGPLPSHIVAPRGLSSRVPRLLKWWPRAPKQIKQNISGFLKCWARSCPNVTFPVG